MLDESEYPECQVKVQSGPDGFQPYDHQTASWNKLEHHFLHAKQQRGILVIPTGGGKTLIAVWWALTKHVARGGRVLWLTHRRNLIRQAYATFQKFSHLLPESHEHLGLIAVTGLDGAWSQVSLKHDVVLATIQTTCLSNNTPAVNLMVDQTKDPGLLIIIDEAHHASAPSYQSVLKSLLTNKKCSLLGLTATPVSMNDAAKLVLGNTFGTSAVHTVTKVELVQQKILAHPIPETVETQCQFERDFNEQDIAHLKRFGELSEKVLTSVASSSPRNKLIVEHYLKRREEYGKTIIFANNVLHVQTLVNEFKQSGVTAEWVAHIRSDSARVIEQFSNPDSPSVLINVEMLTEGIDIPKAKTVFLVRPTRSDALFQQMIGRVLRGPKAGGTSEAYLVSFVDTWSQFHPLDSHWVLTDGEVEEVEAARHLRPELVPILPELISAAYELVRNNVQGSFLTFHSRLPHSWYVWEEEVDDDVLRGRVLVYDNQIEGYQQLEREFKDQPANIPAEVTEDWARGLIRDHFARSTNDPLPRSLDIAALLQAWKKAPEGVQVGKYTFEEKRTFDPTQIAEEIHRKNLGSQDQPQYIRSIWDSNPACQACYRNDLRSFINDIRRELNSIEDRDLLRVGPQPKLVYRPPAAQTLRSWPEGDTGYLLGTISGAVLAQGRNFPTSNDKPTISEIEYSDKPLKGRWGWYSVETRSVRVNCVLNSPDVPRYVLEFLVYHELLHAEMPNDYHNARFRERERRFCPSPDAVADARQRGQPEPTSLNGWFALANQFLDTLRVNFGDPHGKAPEWAM